MIPRIPYDDLSPGELRRLRRRMQAPALWALQVLAGQVGVDAAIDACKLREGGLGAPLREHLRAGGFSPLNLPRYEAAVALVFACRVLERHKGPGAPPLQAVAVDLGTTLDTCQAALRAADALGPEGPIG